MLLQCDRLVSSERIGKVVSAPLGAEFSLLVLSTESASACISFTQEELE